MLKKSLAWVLTLALLLSTLSGLALISSASSAKFSLANYVSGTPLYRNATMNLDSVTAKGGSTAMSDITGNATDRYAYFMAHQNDQLGINIPASVGMGSNVTIEVKFWSHETNLADTRLGLNYTTASGQSDYGDIKMSGGLGKEYVTVASKMTGVQSATVTMADGGSTTLTAGGWKILKVVLTDADFNSAGKVNLVKWSHNNGDNTGDGWYVESLLVYDTNAGAPDSDDLYIREDTIGTIDFTSATPEKDLLSYTATGSSFADGALKLAKSNNYALTVTADDVRQACVMSTDTTVTIMAEVREGDSGEWKVVRKDITANTGVSFEFGTLLFGDMSADNVYVRKVLACRTNLIVSYTNANAFVNFDEPYALYNYFQRVTETNWKATYSFEGDGCTIKNDDGKDALYAASGYLGLNIDDAFTTNAGKPVADLGITITYLDKGTGTLKVQYNQAIPDSESDAVKYQFVAKDVVTLTNTGDWKTATVYLSDAQFRNAANGNDFRIPMGDISDSAIAAVVVSIGADKTELNRLINKVINRSKYTDASLAVYDTALAAAKVVAANTYATKAQVDAAITSMNNAIDGLVLKDGDSRFTSVGALWDPTLCDGEIVTLDGWYCWAFPANETGKYFGIGDEDGVLNNATSVTYEYEIYFVSTNNNDRCFMGYGTKDGWVGVKEGAPPTGNGFAVGGQWGTVPSAETWGKITLTNDNYDPTSLTSGFITQLGTWFEHGELYIRSVKVYDTSDPTKFIQLQFNEDVVDLIVEPNGDGVVETTKEGSACYVIPSGWKSLDLYTDNLVEAGTGIITKGENKITIEFEYYLEDCDNANEMFQVYHYNPDGNGQNTDKSAVCEHQYDRGEGMVRNLWAKMTVELDDANFGNGVIGLKYGNGSNLYIRGIKVYATDGGTKPAQWGTMLITGDIAMDHAFYDWDTGESYGMKIEFNEGQTPTTFGLMDGYKAAVITDDRLYINVDDKLITEENSYIRIDIRHMDSATMYVRYNKVVDNGIDDSAEPYLTQYRFHASGENEAIVDGANAWKSAAGEADFINMLGVIKPASEDSMEWMTTSIYLTDAQFRNAANGSDFRIHTVGLAVISRVDVYVITAEEAAAELAKLGDMTKMTDAIAAVKQENPNPSDSVQEALDEAEAFVTYNYRATQAEIDAAVVTLNAAVNSILGDVNGDGLVNTTDARKVLQYAAEKIDASMLDLSVADVDRDGNINTTDGRLILQLAAEKIPEFPDKSK